MIKMKGEIVIMRMIMDCMMVIMTDILMINNDNNDYKQLTWMVSGRCPGRTPGVLAF